MAEEKERKFGYTNIPNEVIEMEIPPLEKTILIILYRYNNSQKGYSFPSYSILTEKCCVSKNSIIKGLNNLEKKGFITKETLIGKGNKYYINIGVDKNYTSSENEPVQNLHQFKNYTSSENEQHQFEICTPPVQNLNPTNTNINTNINTNNTCGSKEPFKASKSSKRETKKFDDTSIEYKLSKTLLESIREINPKFKEPNLQNWSKDFDKIIRLDKREIKDITDLIDWIYKNDFWKSNILSPGKLRKQFDNLYTKMINDKEYKKTTQNQAKENSFEYAKCEPLSVDEAISDIKRITLGEKNA